MDGNSKIIIVDIYYKRAPVLKAVLYEIWLDLRLNN